jgi:rRNA maturation endonuclease Nob1
MPKAACVTCGQAFYGWALEIAQNRVCSCGGELKIIVKKEKDEEPRG